MITRQFDIILDTKNLNTLSSNMVVTQNDRDVNILKIKVFNGAQEINYASLGQCKILFEKQDWNVVEGNLTKVSDGFTYRMGTNEIACPGKVTAIVQLNGTNNERLSTSKFRFEVVRDLETEHAVKSTSEFSILKKIVVEFQEEKTKIDNAIAGANSAAANANTSATNANNAATNANNAANTAKTIPLQYVNTKAQLLTTYPNPQLGYLVNVKVDETRGNKSIWYRYNGTTWVPYYEQSVEAIDGIIAQISAPLYSVPQEETSSIISLPANVTKGQLSVNLFGRTETNLVGDGEFILIGGKPTGQWYDWKNVKLEIGKTYFIKVEGVQNCDVQLVDSTKTINMYRFTQDGISKKITVTTVDNILRYFPTLVNVDIKFKIIIIEVNSTLSVNELNPAFPNYFSNTKSTLPVRVKGTNRNIFNKIEFIQSTRQAGATVVETTEDGFPVLAITIPTVGYNPANMNYLLNKILNERYTITYTAKAQVNVNARLVYEYTDGTNTQFTNISTTWQTYSQASVNGKQLQRVRIAYSASGTFYIRLDNIQVERGTVATDYVSPAIGNEAYIPAIGGSLPNCIKDEFTDKGEHVKRVGYYVLKSEDILALNTSYNNIDFIPIAKRPDYIMNGVVSSNAFLNTIVQEGTLGTITPADDVSRVGYISNSTATQYVLIVAKGTYASLTEARNALAGKSVIYQLAQEVTTKIDGIEPLIAHPNGTIYVEPIVRGEKIYSSTGISVETAYPIKNIEAVWKVVGNTYTPVDLSKVVVASNKLSFTITGGVLGEEYRYIYEYPSEITTLPTIRYSYPLNTAAGLESAQKIGEKNSREISDLWLTLLPLADRELRMHVISNINTPSTATVEEVANKVNQILNVWK